MKHLFALLLAVVLWPLAAQDYTISGKIKDKSSGELLVAATVYATPSEAGTYSNNYGFYSLTLPRGKHVVSVSYIGYQTISLEIDLQENQTYDIDLSSEIELEEIEIISDRVTHIEEQVQMSQVTIPIQQIKTMPSFLGEVDIMRTLQLLPGIQSAGELQSGILVRGGSKDQNLIIMDGVPVYNVSHVLGLFSIFNADAIKNTNVIKGGFPARYGGRLSSVVDLQMKDGHQSEFHGSGSIGMIASKLMLEGPIGKKTTFLVSGRRMYWDAIARPFINSATSGSDEKVVPTAHFYDLNAKISHRISDKDRLYLSFYQGRDVFKIKYSYADDDYKQESDVGPVWGNRLGALRWNRKLNEKMFLNTTIAYTNYQIDFKASLEEEFEEDKTTFFARYLSGIEDISARVNLDWSINPEHYIRTGVSSTRHTYTPGAFGFKFEDGAENVDTTVGSPSLNALENFIFVEDEMNLGRFRANVGLHVSHFAVRDENFFSFEPRIGINYQLANRWALKASYARMRQYINLISSESLSLPSDFWVPSTDRIRPQRSYQFAAGVAKTINNDYEFSAEVYYKEMKDVISYREGANFLIDGINPNSSWENQIVQGDGETYGLELFLQKKSGRFTGWIGYTLSWNWRQFDDINSGRRFPFYADRRHDFSVAANYKITDRIRVSGSWVYATGNAVSLPTAVYPVTEESPWSSGVFVNTVAVFDQKNNFRLSDYHRLDVSVEFSKQKRKHKRTWVLGAYNAYNHVNPLFVARTTNFENGMSTTRFREIGIMPIVPSISYKFEF